MTENNKDKDSYLGETKKFIIQQPETWGKVMDCLRENFDVDITEKGKVILENKTKEKDEITN